jgi:Protein of unknown function (DUF3176)
MTSDISPRRVPQSGEGNGNTTLYSPHRYHDSEGLSISQSLLSQGYDSDRTMQEDHPANARRGDSVEQQNLPSDVTSHEKMQPESLSSKPNSDTLIRKIWLTEILAAILALVAMAAIMITLGTHNGRPLPDWPYQISINALVSIFSVIFKGAMMVPIAEGKLSD